MLEGRFFIFIFLNHFDSFLLTSNSVLLSVLSPVNYDKKMLEMIGKKLKKNSVALDIVDFGEDDDGKSDKLEALLGAVNNNDSSHIVHVPAGQSALSDVLIRYNCFLYLV